MRISTHVQDAELEKVLSYFRGIRHLESKVGMAIREAIDGVINGRHTGRFSIDQLEKTEKTYIGTRVEHGLLYTLGLPKYQKMDTRVDGLEVDIKFSIHEQWEFPREAVGKLCLLASAEDAKSRFRLGLVRATEEVLNPGRNQDAKRKLSAAGKRTITWLVPNGALPPNFMLLLDRERREKILAKPAGQQRVTELFRVCTGMVVDGVTVETVGQQRDSSKRVRDARKVLAPLGIAIFSHFDNARLRSRGLQPLTKGEFMSCLVD